MKKILSCFVILFAAVSLYATELNVYASGLKVHQTSAGATIDYVLNAPATSLVVNLYGPENKVTPAKTINLTGEDLDKGSHTGVAIDLAGLASAVYSWEIVASADARATDEKISIAAVAVGNGSSRGMTIDDNTESPLFGTIYVAKNSGTGKIVAARADFGSVNDIVTGKWTENQNSSPMRLAIGEDGLLYVSDASDATPNVTIIDRSTNSTSLVFGGEYGAGGVAKNDQNVVIHGSMPGLCVLGKGDGRVLYTIDEDVKVDGHMAIYGYRIGKLASPWTEAPSDTMYVSTNDKIANWNENIAPDGQGGFWIGQNRYSDAASNPGLSHVNASGEMDWFSTGALTANSCFNTRASLFVDYKDTLVLTASDGSFKVWKPYFNGDVVDSVVLQKSVAVQGLAQTYNIIMDRAHNVYLLDGSNLMAYALAGSNECATPAPTTEYISLPCYDHLYEIGTNNSWAINPGVEMDKVATNVFEKEITFTETESFFKL